MSRKEKVFAPTAPLHPLIEVPRSPSWFFGKTISWLWSDGFVKVHGVRGENGEEDVVSRVTLMDCEEQHRFARRAARLAGENEDGI